MTTIGVIGVGNMGSGLVKGWLRAAAGQKRGIPSGVDHPSAGDPSEAPVLIVWDKVEAAAKSLLESAEAREAVGGASALSLTAAGSMEELVAGAEVILVVVKPRDAQEVLARVGRQVDSEQAVVSAMAGLKLESLRAALGSEASLFRIMPNLGVEVGAGAVALAAEPGVGADELDRVLRLFRPLGLVEVLPEELFDAVTAVSGSSPAFLAVAVEGLEDGAVAAGLSRSDAREVVRAAALELARELRDGGESPAEMRSRLLAEGSLDAEMVAALDEGGVRATFRQAVEAAIERSRQMAKA